MVSTRQIKCRLVIVTLAICSGFLYSQGWLQDRVYATDSKTTKLTKEQSDAIIQNCSNIKQSLVKLQHVDSRTRTYLGAAYETINGHFITPLNLRLVKNNIPSNEIFKIQGDFVSAQANFRDNYVEYMRELESLATVDCVAKPQEFYDKLVIVREKREKLAASTKKLSNLIDLQYKAVEELQKTL